MLILPKYYFYNIIINQQLNVFLLAEKGGFEPPLGYYPKHAFQACDLNHSSTSPQYLTIISYINSNRYIELLNFLSFRIPTE